MMSNFFVIPAQAGIQGIFVEEAYNLRSRNKCGMTH